jgi:hypothetical protein
MERKKEVPGIKAIPAAAGSGFCLFSPSRVRRVTSA